MNIFAIIKPSGKDRYQMLDKLMSSVIQNNLSFVIMRTKPSFFELFHNLPIKVFSNYAYAIYVIDKHESIKSGIKYLLKIDLWHKPIFHILIGEQNLPSKIKAYLEANKKNIDKMEEDLKESIIGFIDPVDNDFEIYGNEAVKSLIKQIFPESII